MLRKYAEKLHVRAQLFVLDSYDISWESGWHFQHGHKHKEAIHWFLFDRDHCLESYIWLRLRLHWFKGINGVARTLRTLRTPKGEHCTMQCSTTISSLFKMGTFLALRGSKFLPLRAVPDGMGNHFYHSRWPPLIVTILITHMRNLRNGNGHVRRCYIAHILQPGVKTVFKKIGPYTSWVLNDNVTQKLASWRICWCNWRSRSEVINRLLKHCLATPTTGSYLR